MIVTAGNIRMAENPIKLDAFPDRQRASRRRN
jgi:hypothetical protein